MSQLSSWVPSPGSVVVTPHLLLSSNGAKWPVRNGFHHIHVRQCYDVWRAAIGCDSNCQSLLFPRQELLNLTWWVEYTATPSVTSMQHNINAILWVYGCTCVWITITYLSALADLITHMEEYMLHAQWPSQHVGNNLLIVNDEKKEIEKGGVCVCRPYSPKTHTEKQRRAQIRVHSLTLWHIILD